MYLRKQGDPKHLSVSVNLLKEIQTWKDVRCSDIPDKYSDSGMVNNTFYFTKSIHHLPHKFKRKKHNLNTSLKNNKPSVNFQCQTRVSLCVYIKGV